MSKLQPKESQKSPKSRFRGGLGPLWGASWPRVAYLTRFGGYLEDSGARSGGAMGPKGAQGSPMGAQWGANGSQSDPKREPEVSLGRPMDPAEPHTGRFWLEQGKPRKNYFIGSERLGGSQTGAKWHPFGASVELLWPTGSLLGARRGVWEAFASPEGRFRALFEPQWLRRGVLEPQMAPKGVEFFARGRRVAAALQSDVREIIE